MAKHKDRRVALSAGQHVRANHQEPTPRAGLVVSAFEDAGISGAKGREQRPGLDALMKARREIDMVSLASCWR
jgi:hypothetical protein